MLVVARVDSVVVAVSEDGKGRAKVRPEALLRPCIWNRLSNPAIQMAVRRVPEESRDFERDSLRI